jgi:putative hydrolase of the HAD superfamily
VIRAVFFDWGNTLCAWELDPELFLEGHARGLAAIGGRVPEREAFTAAYEQRVLPLLLGPEEDEIDYVAEIGSLLATLGVEADRDAALRFVAAEHAVWRPAHRLEPDVLALLDGLRERGLAVGLVSNVFDPPELMRGLFAELGLLQRLDAIALSTEVGKRKPHRAIFASALEQVGALPSEAVMVGDRLREDIAGAQAAGLAAVQAAWFSRDGSGAATAAATAEAPADVLRWLGTT